MTTTIMHAARFAEILHAVENKRMIDILAENYHRENVDAWKFERREIRALNFQNGTFESVNAPLSELDIHSLELVLRIENNTFGPIYVYQSVSKLLNADEFAMRELCELCGRTDNGIMRPAKFCPHA